MIVNVYYLQRNGAWKCAGSTDMTQPVHFSDDHASLTLELEGSGNEITYALTFACSFLSRVKLEGTLAGDSPWHLIPCNIYGDNNLAHAVPDQYPNLTTSHPDSIFSSAIWEFRADRASHPLSACFTSKGAAGISIDPYSSAQDGHLVRNGLFASLPDKFGVTLGYANLPFTFVEKRTLNGVKHWPSTSNLIFRSSASGRFFWYPGETRLAAGKMMKSLYTGIRRKPTHRKSCKEAAQALVDRFIDTNWGHLDYYSNMACQLPENPKLRSWRPLCAVGWTGGTVLAYPFLVAESVLGLAPDYFRDRDNGWQIFNQVADSLNPKSGLLFDLYREWNGSRLNGWWSGFGLTRDRHCAYTNGQALYYLMKAVGYLRQRQLSPPPEWEATATTALETFIRLQRDDGNFGFSFSAEKPEVIDWDGFAGCWITAAMAQAALVTAREDFRIAAIRGAEFYHQYVRDLNCWGTPMDTWKSVDQEGNLAFVKTARLLHQLTGEEKFLAMLEDGATYEYTWRYAFKAIPCEPPLAGTDWNSCGGSVTSVSNPHIHPMALIITEDIFYLATATDSIYHRNRAEDTIAWAMNCLELYPEIASYGDYGVLTERFCPSDGCIIDSYADGRPNSLWTTYNGWAAANVLEGLLWMIDHEKSLP